MARPESHQSPASSDGLSRRRFILGAAAAVVSPLVLAACGSAGETASPSSSASGAAGAPAGSSAAAGTSAAAGASTAAAPASASGAPKSGGTLRVGQVGDIATLDPSFSPNTIDVLWSVYDRLTAYNLKHEPQPMLAESWDISSDFKKATLHLRKGVQFHSGRELTSDDVKYTIGRLQKGGFNGQLQKQAQWFTGIDTPDKYTVVLTSDTSRPGIFDFFEYANIVDKDTLEGPNAKTKAVGTGPFQFVEWAQGDHMQLTRNKNYWQKSQPYVDGVTINFVKDSQAMMVQMESGALDVVATPPLLDFTRLKSGSGYQGLLHPDSGAPQTIGMSVPKPPFDDKRVRQAFSYAVNRKYYVDTILHGAGQVGSLPWSSNSPAYDATKDAFYTFDLTKAEALLRQAGVSKLDIDVIVTSGNAEIDAFNQVLQADLAKLGVTAHIRNMALAEWLDTVNHVKFTGLWVGGIAYAQLEPFDSFLMSRGLDPTNNSSGFTSERYTQLVNSAAGEPDAAKRKQIYSQLNDLFLDESFLIILSRTPARVLATSKVHDLTPTLHGTFWLGNAWLG